MVKKINKTAGYLWGMLTIILAGTAGWALYALINRGFEDILLSLGVTNTYLQLILVLAFVIVLFIFGGMSFKKSINKIVK